MSSYSSEVLDLECLEGGSSSSDNGETKMNDFVCLGQLGSACEAQSIKSEIDIYKDEELPSVLNKKEDEDSSMITAASYSMSFISDEENMILYY